MDEDFINHIDEFQKSQLKSRDLLKNDILICECNCVSTGDIREFFDTCQKVQINQLKEGLLLGTGCSQCLNEANDWVEKIF